jgi:hypothetical protein
MICKSPASEMEGNLGRGASKRMKKLRLGTYRRLTLQSMINSLLKQLSFLTSQASEQQSPLQVSPAAQSSVSSSSRGAEFNSINQNKSFFQVHDRLYISLFDASRTSQVAVHELTSNFLIIPYDKIAKERLVNPILADSDELSIADIHDFDSMMSARARQNAGSKLVVCAGTLPVFRARTVVLLGSHMIISHGLSLETVARAFDPLRDLLQCTVLEDSMRTAIEDAVWAEELTASNCWGALSSAMAAGMIDFGHPFAPSSDGDSDGVCIEELLHYSECVPDARPPLHGPAYSALQCALVPKMRA